MEALGGPPESDLPWSESGGVEMGGLLCLGMGYVGLQLSDEDFATDLWFWAISGSQSLVQTSPLAICDLRRGPQAAVLRTGEKAAWWCWSPGSREALEGTPESLGTVREFLRDRCLQGSTVNFWPLGPYVASCLLYLSALLLPLSARVFITHERGGGFLPCLPWSSHELVGGGAPGFPHSMPSWLKVWGLGGGVSAYL